MSQEENQQIVEIVGKIAQHYYSTSLSVHSAIQKVLELGISKIEESGGVVYITLSRPGLLIGHKGINIYTLEQILGKKIGITQEKSIVDKIVDSISYLDPNSLGDY